MKQRTKEVLEVRKYPDPILRKKSKLVKVIDISEQKLFNDMVITMHQMKGVGLAAPQVGVLRRLIVVDIGDGVIKLANPEIVKSQGSDKLAEGCLSVPDQTIEIERPSEIVVGGLNARGERVSITAQGLLARVIQHEMDHLDGKLIIDYAVRIRGKTSLGQVTNY